ncbi:MAG: hypothetical protein AAGI37_18070 [Planctomycetota bacterium]
MILQVKTGWHARQWRASSKRWLLRLLVLFCSLSSAGNGWAEGREPEEGRVITLTLPLESGRVTGTITRYNALTFTLTTDQDKQHRVLWNAIPADKVDRYWRYLEEPEGDADGLFDLGDLLIRHRDGEALAKRAFDEALRLAPELAEAVERSLADKEPDGTPRFVGTADPEMWGELSDETMRQGVDTLRGFAVRAQRELGIEMRLYESERFLLLTDVDAELVGDLSVKLAETYQAVAELLGDNPAENIFVGKCLIALFDHRVDYIRFQNQLHDTDARGTGGLCHGFGNGHVHIAAFRRGHARQTNHVVAHELVHAYLHRYQSPQPLDDWINEGLAEHLAHQIEPPPGQNLYLKSRLLLEGKQGLGQGFYDAPNLSSWQYDIAGALTGYLIERSDKAYPKFISAIKQGTEVGGALKTIYRMTPAKLTQRFKQRLDRELNKKLGG